ncbi:MAG TPA: dihydroorotate dehydrogenase electron transfer subunit [Candidatus Cloacimonas sp.]|nr:dihydroorotate dehydrogenase electron transfer subunit [Candidatus Cloacimonas acidaminovorans]HRU83150.1 dihydroorotate dehydrogenase electron transfer subunit [Candidatus Cloacimonas sp.]HPL51902.1 dihydroorotate dehydrogenase electron transfer subunit [Candidatus Cloacimonas acidaminovorans]HQF35380.1 dihydroorotate dehydrogenase electron transfer subunit [Candidatus Cloacimonas acidaminovorans]HQI53121.1 dihydroorotate dehydrogenase electron transfer subunit [Candidatus Cloacimonas acida
MNKSQPQFLERAIYFREELSGDYFILWIWDEALGKKCQPGQFFQIRAHYSIADAEETRSLPKLFKPISIYDNAEGRIGFFIKKVGAGTNALYKLKAGDLLELIGPSGNGFPLVTGRKILLVSGGIGYPPLWYLQKKLIKHNLLYWVHGGSGQSDVFPCDEVWTEDGSFGKKGMVTEGMGKLIAEKKIDLVYSCGPVPMLKECAIITTELNIEHYCSIEAYMACGIGVCYGCAIPVGQENDWNYLRVCKEGPVFNAREVLWNKF